MNSSFIRKCFACKQSINVFDSKLDSNNLLYVDNHFYHKDCYKKMKIVKKKCYQCKKDIEYGLEKKDNGVYYDKHYFHDICFDRWCFSTKRITPKRKFAIENKNLFINEYTDNMNLLLKNRLNKNISINKMNQDAIDNIAKIKKESDLNNYLKDKYNLNVISSNVWRRLNSVYNGTYKNLEKPIPAEHLLDMWKRRNKKLNRIYQNNINKGKEINGENLLIYDLAVIVGDYDSYLNWLDKQKVLDASNENTNIDLNSFNKTVQNFIKNKNIVGDDLSKDVDELF